jgi:hypothetical protein
MHAFTKSATGLVKGAIGYWQRAEPAEQVRDVLSRWSGVLPVQSSPKLSRISKALSMLAFFTCAHSSSELEADLELPLLPITEGFASICIVPGFAFIVDNSAALGSELDKTCPLVSC